MGAVRKGGTGRNPFYGSPPGSSKLLEIKTGGRGRCAAPAVYPFLRREKKSAIEPKPEPVAVGAEAPLRA
jgi:hypothetical protein